MTPHQSPPAAEGWMQLGGCFDSFAVCLIRKKKVSAARAHNQQKCGLAAQMIDERRASRPSVMCHAWALGGLPGRVGARSSDSTSVLPFIMVAGDRHERSTLCPAPSMRLTAMSCSRWSAPTAAGHETLLAARPSHKAVATLAKSDGVDSSDVYI